MIRKGVKSINIEKFFRWLGGICIFLFVLLTVIRSWVLESYDLPLATNFLAPAGKIMNNETTSFSFAAISDTGARNEPIERILNEIRKSKNHFILYLGDLVRFRNASHFSWVVDELNQKLPGFPFYAVPGNHEVTRQNGKIDRSLYLETFGTPYYWFGYGNTLFIGLDSAEGKLDLRQLRWLQTTLQKIRPVFENCIIYSHIPPVAPNGETFRILDQQSSQRLAEIIKKHRVNLLMFGHLHYFARSQFAGIPLIILPSSGQPVRSTEKRFGYVVVKINDGDIRVKERYVDSGNDTEHFEVFITSMPSQWELKIVLWGLLASGLLLLAISYILGIIRKKKP